MTTEEATEDGRPVVRVVDGTGRAIGTVVRMRGVLRPELDLEHGGRRIGSVKVTDRRQRVVRVYDAAGTEVAQMRTITDDTPLPVPDDTDGYCLQVHRPVEEPLRSLVVACAIVLQSFITTESSDATFSVTFPGIPALLDRFRRRPATGRATGQRPE